jgi:hypothetical protein
MIVKYANIIVLLLILENKLILITKLLYIR